MFIIGALGAVWQANEAALSKKDNAPFALSSGIRLHLQSATATSSGGRRSIEAMAMAPTPRGLFISEYHGSLAEPQSSAGRLDL